MLPARKVSDRFFHWFTILAALFAAWAAFRLPPAVIEMPTEITQTDDLRTTWTSDGLEVEVITRIQNHGSILEAAVAHRAAVDAMLEQFPKDA